MALADSAHELSEPDEGIVLDGAPRAAVTVELLGPLRRVLRHANLQQTVLRAFPLQAPRGVPFFVRLGLVEKADPDQFAATADRVAIFELQPADGADEHSPR